MQSTASTLVIAGVSPVKKAARSGSPGPGLRYRASGVRKVVGQRERRPGAGDQRVVDGDTAVVDGAVGVVVRGVGPARGFRGVADLRAAVVDGAVAVVVGAVRAIGVGLGHWRRASDLDLEWADARAELGDDLAVDAGADAARVGEEDLRCAGHLGQRVGVAVVGRHGRQLHTQMHIGDDAVVQVQLALAAGGHDPAQVGAELGQVEVEVLLEGILEGASRIVGLR